MAGTKISDLPELTTPTGDEELVYAYNDTNGKIKISSLGGNEPTPFSSWVDYCKSVGSLRSFTKQAGNAISNSSLQWTATHPGYFTKAITNISTPYAFYVYINGCVVFDGYATNSNTSQASLQGISFKQGDELRIYYNTTSYTVTVYGYEFY